MQRRKFYLITLLLILLALICQFVGMNKISEPSRAIAKSLTIPKAEGKQLKLKAADEAKIGKASLFVGIGLAVLAAISCWLSAINREPISRAIPMALLGFYILSQFLLV